MIFRCWPSRKSCPKSHNCDQSIKVENKDRGKKSPKHNTQILGRRKQFSDMKWCWNSVWQHLLSVVEEIWWFEALVVLKWEICTAKDLEQEKGRLSLCFVVPYSAYGYSRTGVDFQSNSDIYRNYSEKAVSWCFAYNGVVSAVTGS